MASTWWLATTGMPNRADAAEPLQPAVLAWLQAQTNLHAWSAQVTQTRTLKTLTQPLTATGRVWFSEPNRFRWEIGDPPTTIAAKDGRHLLVLYPRLGRAERYDLNAERGAAGPWKDMLAILEAGFPRSVEALEERFHVREQKSLEDHWRITLEPRSPAAKRFMPQIKVTFDAVSLALLATELHFADGSVMRNDFALPVLNPSLPENLFTPVLGENVRVTEPLGP